MKEGKRAAIYCRVSTSSDAQVESLDKQVLEAIEATKQLGCVLVDRFIDAGKTGTTKEARKEYLRMLSQIEEQKFDVIITKSLDRMNRNILDFYLFLDLIIKHNIQLYFYLDRAYYKADDKIIIGIKAILAEEYSRELSKKLCNAHAKRQEKGDVLMLSSRTYGYRKVVQPDGRKKVVVEEEEADMIRLIFEYCKNGYGARGISKVLLEKGYRNRNGNPVSEGTIRRIIRNPLVMGTMVMNRVRYDFNSKTTIKTCPSQWIWKEGAVPAIISNEDWKLANEQMDSRVKSVTSGASEKKQGINTGKFDLSGKIVCGLCGKTFYRIKKVKKTERVIQWKCSTYIQFGRRYKAGRGLDAQQNQETSTVGCDALVLDQNCLIELLGDVARTNVLYPKERKMMIREVMTILNRVLQETNKDGTIERLQKERETIVRRQEALLEKYVDDKITDDNYSKMNGRLQEARERAEKEIEATRIEKEDARNVNHRLHLIERFLQEDGFVRATAYSLLESISCMVVYPDSMNLIFPSYTQSIPLEPHQLNPRQFALDQSEQKICDMISKNPKTTLADMAQVLGVGERTAFSRVSRLKTEGKIEVRGHGSGARWHLLM